MTTPETLMIGNVKYTREDSVPDTNGNTKIVVLDRGFVYVGQVIIRDDCVIITDAKNIRYWGTTKGLGELVNGPLPTTKVDKTGLVTVPLKAVIFFLDVVGAKWNRI